MKSKTFLALTLACGALAVPALLAQQTVEKTYTTPKGGTVTVNKTFENKEGTVSKTITNAEGKTVTVDKSIDANATDQRVGRDKTVTLPSGKTIQDSRSTTWDNSTATKSRSHTGRRGRSAGKSRTWTRRGARR